MGLDTSHDCWHGPYTAFTRWRDAITEAAGYTLEDRVIDGIRWKYAKEIDWDSFTEENYQGEWKKWPDDPLIILIAHSDCEGRIPVEHCAPLANRLEGLLPTIEPPYVPLTQQFIRGLRDAFAKQEDVEFH